METGRFVAALLGVHVGDALGATTEFADRTRARRTLPADVASAEIVGGGAFGWAPGAATDDTDLTLAIVRAYLELQDRGAGDLVQTAADHMLRWREAGPRDIGGATRQGLDAYAGSGDPRSSGVDHDRSQGNGSLMRTLPVALARPDDAGSRAVEAAELSAITHAHPVCRDACVAYCDLVAGLVTGRLGHGTGAVSAAVRSVANEGHRHPAVRTALLGGLATPLDEVEGGGGDASGWVVTSLTLAIAALVDPRPAAEVLLEVARLGGDADTNGAIAGGLLGARDGPAAWPERWLGRLEHRRELQAAAERFAASATPGPRAAHDPATDPTIPQDLLRLTGSASDGLLRTDPDGTITWVNPALCLITGAAREELLGSTLAALVEPAFRGAFLRDRSAALAEGPQHYETMLHVGDGPARPVRVRDFPITEDGRLQRVYSSVRDLDEQEALLHSLQERDARLSAMFEHATNGFVIIDDAGRIIEANPEFARTVGRTPQELVGLEEMSLVHADDRERARALQQRVRGGSLGSYLIEKRYETPNDAIVWVRASIVPLPTSLRRGPELLVTTEDVTHHRAAEASLRHGRSLLGMAGRIARVGGWAMDLPSRRLHWSEEISELLERDPELDPPGLDEVLEIYDAPDRATIAAALEATVNKGAAFDLMLQLRTFRGRKLWVRVVGEALRDQDGAITGAVGALQDITAQQEVAEELRQLAEQLEATLESITDGFLALDRGWRVTWLNSSAERLLRRSRDEVIGQDLWEAFPEAAETEIGSGLREAMDRGEPLELERVHCAPLHLWVRASAYPYEHGLTVFFQDISPQVAYEDNTKRILAAEQRAVEELRRLNATKTSLLSAVSHELRTPLTVIHGMADTLRRLRDDLDPTRRERLEDALAANTERLQELVADLLDLDRLTRGAVDPQRLPTDLVRLLRRCIDRARLADRCELESPSRLDAAIDAVQFERIVDNLLSNVVKYAPDGPVQVLLRHDGSTVHLEVSDHGPGIPSNAKHRIFEPFFRVDEHHPSPGTGIGLTLVAEFARLHGGRARVDDVPGGGARMVVELPDGGVSVSGSPLPAPRPGGR